jgi:hypothetical protein
MFQDAVARVEYVEGEFYWKVEAGEQARATDYVNAPLMLSKEVPVASSRRGGGNISAEEINWSLGAYTPLKEIERKFSVDLPSPKTVAPNQPWPHKKVYAYWALLTLVALVLGFFTLVTAPRKTVFEQTYSLQATPTPSPSPGVVQAPEESGNEKTQVIFTDPINLTGGRNLRVTGRALNVDNNWLYVAGDFIEEQTGLIQQFDLPMESYHGVEDGESWSEGDPEQAAYLPALPEGRYTLRLEAQWENWNQPTPPQFSVRVEQGVPRLANLLLLLVALSLIPLLFAFRHFSFERRRWADSAFNPYASGGGDDSDNSSDE